MRQPEVTDGAVAHPGVELRGETREPVRQALIYCPDLYERLPGGPAARAVQYHIAGAHPCTLVVQDDTQHFTLQAPSAGPGACRWRRR